jgi:hypothetical protein
MLKVGIGILINKCLVLQPDCSVQNFLIPPLPMALLKTAGLRFMTPCCWASIAGHPEQIVMPSSPECGNPRKTLLCAYLVRTVDKIND